MLSLMNRIKTTHLFFRLVKDPNRTDLIFKGVDIISNDKDQSVVDKLVKGIFVHNDFRDMYEARYMPKTPKMDELAKMPKGSFGRTVYQHMLENNIDFELFPKLQGHRPVDYISARVYQDHDLWHALLGYSTDIDDELGLQAVTVAQIGSPFGVALITGGLLHLLTRDPIGAVGALQKVSEGYQLGKRTKFLLSVKLHEMFERPLEEVRALCGININALAS